MFSISPSHHAQNEEGFTLVELLVVILVIGILSAIAIPAFMNQRKEAADASLKSDLRQIAIAYQSWQSKPGNDNTKFREVLDGYNSIYFLGEGATISPTAPKRYWKDRPVLPPVTISPGNVVEMNVTAVPTGAWKTAHEQGEFCLQGTNPDSGSYTHRGFSGQTALEYANVLYYDQKLGGISTIEDLVAASDNGERTSCYAFAELWKKAARP